MKRILHSMVAIAAIAFPVMAEEATDAAAAALAAHDATEDREVQTFHEQLEDKRITLDLTYSPLTHNLIVVYTIKNGRFDEGDAFIVVRDRIKRFQVEKGYRSYKMLSPDVIKYAERSAELTRSVVFSK